MSSFVNLLDIIYPVGSIYQSFEETSPASTVGGTWSQITNRFLYAGTGTLGSTDGEMEHTLTIAEMPRHYHAPTASAKAANISTGSGYTCPVCNTYGNDTPATTSATGGASPQQYASIYCYPCLETYCIIAYRQVM